MLYIIILAGVAALDLIIKHRIERNYIKDKEKYIFGKAVKIHKYQNKGCFLGFMNKKTGIVRAASLLLTLVCAVLFGVLLSKKGMNAKKAALAFVLGGAVSNEYDIIKKGSVTDYFSINLPFLKRVVFNLGDISIFVGVILLVLGTKEQPR